MAFDEALAGRIRHLLARRKHIEEKKMFGGIGFLLNGNLLVGVRKDSLLVRLGPEQGDEALKEAHVSEFKITGRGTMKGWVVVFALEEDGGQIAGLMRQFLRRHAATK
jgi:TfoX/Sxy family transcriptional regulator of competence genes